jgi:hypothetical protein
VTSLKVRRAKEMVIMSLFRFFETDPGYHPLYFSYHGAWEGGISKMQWKNANKLRQNSEFVIAK